MNQENEDSRRPENPPEPESMPEPRPASDRPLTLEEVREAYVQKNYILLEKSFAKFDRAGGFQPSFSWAGFFFGIFWYFYRKMYTEALIILAASLAAVLLSNTPLVGPLAANLMSLGCNVAQGVLAKWLYWRAVERKIDQAWGLYKRNPDQALGWLRRQGGVNFWAIPLGIALCVAVFAAMLVNMPAVP